ncbi:hypothetical protein BABINDRAFT_160006 [Babjeviella inositovora NRRL Y-12698]|uniref:Homeobox domain-containing protein n=1 Tax=Babjeviella inositovora NRRL Y-12698 TaxID=984486 RepID=A0A1E3QVS4_9ASCO|nr:uncharacterized protein BABINDRAFT_160006 [Babjeviella inositovora NRRL Y-12698]ODQ81765.1 hypothetical protein BABINDRAFT_160006 [Babjeviella inositovora NRRL Y-12698]
MSDSTSAPQAPHQAIPSLSIPSISGTKTSLPPLSHILASTQKHTYPASASLSAPSSASSSASAPRSNSAPHTQLPSISTFNIPFHNTAPAPFPTPVRNAVLPTTPMVSKHGSTYDPRTLGLPTPQSQPPNGPLAIPSLHQPAVEYQYAQTPSVPRQMPEAATAVFRTPSHKENAKGCKALEQDLRTKSFAFISHSQETFPLHEPSIDNAQLARRKRRRTSPAELCILQDEFLKCHTPNRSKRVEIAAKVDMTEKAVQIWFQNRRQNVRKLHMETKQDVHVDLMPVMERNTHPQMMPLPIAENLPAKQYDFHGPGMLRTPTKTSSVNGEDARSQFSTSPLESPTARSPFHSPSYKPSLVPAQLLVSTAPNPAHVFPVMKMMKTPAKKQPEPIASTPQQSTMHSRSSTVMASGASTMTFRLKSVTAKTPNASVRRKTKKLQAKTETSTKKRDANEDDVADVSMNPDDTFESHAEASVSKRKHDTKRQKVVAPAVVEGYNWSTSTPQKPSRETDASENPERRNLKDLLILSHDDEPTQAKKPLAINHNVLNRSVPATKTGEAVNGNGGEIECIEHLLSLRTGNWK